MNVTRLADAKPYAPPRHTPTCHAMHLQHQSLGSDAPYWVGCSYYLPGAKAEWDASPLAKVYVVIDGELTVAVDDEEVTLERLDSVYLGPGENREVRNDTNRVATMLVVMPYPDAAQP
ncbi:MAG TPA: cupin domain-containing protein [Acidimicrobiia bacterium]